MKRLFSFILILCIVVSLFPSATAEEDSVDALKRRIEELEAIVAEKDIIIAELEANNSAAQGILVENVSVGFISELPYEVTSNSTYQHYGNKEDLISNDDQVYAAVEFTVKNQTKHEIKISDIQDDFYIEMNYDNGFIYSTDSDSSKCVLISGNNVAIMSKHSSIGQVVTAPLTSSVVTLYLLCPAAVAESDSSLVISFRCTHSEVSNYNFNIR